MNGFDGFGLLCLFVCVLNVSWIHSDSKFDHDGEDALREGTMYIVSSTQMAVVISMNRLVVANSSGSERTSA